MIINVIRDSLYLSRLINQNKSLFSILHGLLDEAIPPQQPPTQPRFSFYFMHGTLCTIVFGSTAIAHPSPRTCYSMGAIWGCGNFYHPRFRSFSLVVLSDTEPLLSLHCFSHHTFGHPCFPERKCNTTRHHPRHAGFNECISKLKHHKYRRLHRRLFSFSTFCTQQRDYFIKLGFLVICSTQG